MLFYPGKHEMFIVAAVVLLLLALPWAAYTLARIKRRRRHRKQERQRLAGGDS